MKIIAYFCPYQQVKLFYYYDADYQHYNGQHL